MNENLKTVTHLKVLLALATAAGTLRATSFGFACVLICEMIFSCVAAPGDIDPSFDFGSGIDGPVKAALIQSDGKILIAGAFTTINGLVRPSVARLSNPNRRGFHNHQRIGSPKRGKTFR